jgi:hypothetical protein
MNFVSIYFVSFRFDFVSHFTGTLLMDRDEIVSFRFISFRFVSISFHASYQVSVHLAEGFQRRRLKCEKLKGATDAK